MSGADVSMQMLLSFAQLARLYAANWIPQPTDRFLRSSRKGYLVITRHAESRIYVIISSCCIEDIEIHTADPG